MASNYTFEEWQKLSREQKDDYMRGLLSLLVDIKHKRSNVSKGGNKDGHLGNLRFETESKVLDVLVWEKQINEQRD